MANGTGFGNHPTIYGLLTDEQLMEMYHEKIWSTLDESSRQQLLQETVNRQAAAMGEVGSPEVRFADLDQRTHGLQGNGVIEVNRQVLARDTYQHNFNGTIIEEKVVDSNFKALETVLHENVHAWQDQCTAGIIHCPDPKLLEEYQANNFTTVRVPDGKGGITVGTTYMNGVAHDGIEDSASSAMLHRLDYFMYYFQSSERDARRWSEEHAARVAASLQGKYGEDASTSSYLKYIQTSGYQAKYNDAVMFFNNPNFEKEINTVLTNYYYDRHVPVNPMIEEVVRNEMIESYKDQHGIQRTLDNASKADEGLVNGQDNEIEDGVDDDFGVE